MSRNDWLVHAALVALSLAVFGQVAGHAFILWDDPLYIKLNPVVRNGLTWDGVVRALTLFGANNWHPVTWWSHMLDVQIFGMWPGGHHLVNLFWHVLNTALVFELLRRWTGELWKSAIVAALVAVHPLHVESVAWVAERKDVLSAFFWLTTVLLYGRYVVRPGLMRHWAVSATLLLGLMTKPMLVSLPLILLVLDVWPYRRLSLATGRRDFLRQLRPLVVEKLPWLGLAIASSIVTLVAQDAAIAVGEQWSLAVRLANALGSYGTYLRQTFWPTELSFLYLFVQPRPLAVLLWCSVIAVISGLAWHLRQRWPWLLSGWLWFVISLLPVIGIVKVGMHAHADRYVYLPHVGLLWALVWAAAALAEHLRVRRIWIAAISAALILALAAVATRQVGIWKNGERLFQNALRIDRENFVAHLYLAEEYLAQGRLDDAERHARAGLRLNNSPTVVSGGNSVLGNIARSRRQTALALDHFRLAAAANERSYTTLYNLGIGLADIGDLPAAAAMFERALRLQPDYSEAHNNLGVVRNRMGDLAGATSAFVLALRADPGNHAAAVNLANARVAVGDRVAARNLLIQVLQREPTHAGARRALERLGEEVRSMEPRP